MTIDDLIRNLGKILRQEIIEQNKLPDAGDYITCQCGCGTRFFVSQVQENEKLCTKCMLEIREEDKDKASKLIHRGRVVAILHPNCDPDNLSELFPMSIQEEGSSKEHKELKTKEFKN